ncbi:tryptophan--tRNA ligase [Oceanivirga miroungae]|uniref:Tryptophan--tRNA ligase n=1 Tax=Oceanivirga miroungae TaxID=1130046 RepID=A0A6I8M6W3_9FUSO|nr:tryptophan--tRNA ligase [Oceanivirga miroungae]VWL85135.1 tryptophanyl-tRNA synthetase [Oceanivirga miroungae]
MKKRSLSGIQPSGTLHIGNYFGALKQFVDSQDEYDGLYFLADLHSLTSSKDSEKLKENTKNAVLDYLALGLDPKKSTIFLQSDVSYHAELMWILSNVTPISLLERGHAYKDKIAKGMKPNTGLFTYPVLMAADILLYDTDLVPVGKDQKQHVEFTRDIAIKFNEAYNKNVFKLPEDLILDSVAIVPGTDGEKMSKSYGNIINMFLPEKELKKQVMSIVTDSKGLEEPKDPDNNIVKLYSLFASKEEVDIMKNKFLAGNYGYGHAKKELLESILEYFKDARYKREKLLNNMDYVNEILDQGKKRAQELAYNKMKEVRETIGIYR